MKKTPLKRGNKPLKRSKTRIKASKDKLNKEKSRGLNALNKLNIQLEQKDQMFNLFLAVWGSRKHNCQSCGCWLGSEPRTYMFDHLLEKSKFPQFALDHENIYLCCWDCHTLKTAGFPTSKHQEAIDAYKQKNL